MRKPLLAAMATLAALAAMLTTTTTTAHAAPTCITRAEYDQTAAGQTRTHVEQDIFDGYDGSQADFIHTAGYDVLWRHYAHCADGTKHTALRYRRLDGETAWKLWNATYFGCWTDDAQLGCAGPKQTATQHKVGCILASQWNDIRFLDTRTHVQDDIFNGYSGTFDAAFDGDGNPPVWEWQLRDYCKERSGGAARIYYRRHHNTTEAWKAYSGCFDCFLPVEQFPN